MSKIEQRPTIHAVTLTDAQTGRSVIVSLMWVTTIAETDAGTLFTFSSGETVTVEETLQYVAFAVDRGVAPKRRR